MNVAGVQLRGWKQILAGLLLLVGAYAGYSAWIQSELKDKMPKLVEARLKMDLKSEEASRLLLFGQSNPKPTFDQARQFEAEAKTLEALRVDSISKRGLGGSVVVKVTFSNDGKTLPSGGNIRYYRLKYGWFTGWFVYYKATEVSYQLGWF